MDEIWVDTDLEDYEASSLGRIRNRRTGYARKLLPDKKGYLRFSTYHVENGVRSWGSARVHRVVCAAFHGPAPEDKPWALHRNGDQLDNRPENLYWGTPKENVADMHRHGTARMAGWTSCARGHEYTEGSYYTTRDGKRACKECYRSRRVPPPPEDPRHGKKSTYDNLGCRCTSCTEAKKDWDSAYRERIKNNGV